MRNFEAPFPCAIFSYFFWVYKINGTAFPAYVGRLRRGGGPPAIAELSAASNPETKRIAMSRKTQKSGYMSAFLSFVAK